MGEGDFESALVDQWVDFVWHEVSDQLGATTCRGMLACPAPEHGGAAAALGQVEVVVASVTLPARAGEAPFDAAQVAPYG